MTPRAPLIAVLVLAAVGAARCTEPHPDSAILALEAGQAAWRAYGLPSYDFTLQWINAWFIGRPVLVSVRNGAVTSVVYADSGTAADTSFQRNWLTVDRLFAEVRRQIAAKPGSLHVAYDSLLGYPTEISVDPWVNVADDEYAILASDLKLWAPFSAPPTRP